MGSSMEHAIEQQRESNGMQWSSNETFRGAYHRAGTRRTMDQTMWQQWSMPCYGACKKRHAMEHCMEQKRVKNGVYYEAAMEHAAY